MTTYSNHCHTDRSNFRLKDSINKIDKLIDYAVEIGLAGITISDHETLAAHVQAIQYVKKGKEKGTIPQDFKLGLGNEIYLVDRDEIARARENNESTKFYHFLLTAKDKKGYEGLKKLSSKAWENSFFFKFMERVPTYKDDLENIMKEYRGHIIATTACLGSEFAQTVLKHTKDPSNVEIKKDIHRLVTWYRNIFEEDFFIEIQPSFNEEQIAYNKAAIKIAEAYGVPVVVATDAHYINKEQAIIHETYLKADEGEREVADFYSTTYLMSEDEMWEFFKEYLHPEQFKNFCNNTLDIGYMVQEYDLYHDVIVPDTNIPEFELTHLFEPYYNKYEYIRKYAYSPNIEDRYHLYLVEQGFIKYKQEMNEVNIERLNEEYKELFLTSEKLGQCVSSYYILTKEAVDTMWEVSLVGPGRGSAASWYTVYLLGITQLNPIKYNLPHWRHLTHERPEMPDIDIDSEAAQRANILERIKQKFGHENVLNISTVTREKTRSAILTAARGLGIDNDIAQNIANLVPTDKTGMWTLRECFEGDEEQGKKPVTELVNELNKYPELLETVETIEGLCSGRSVHASGVYIFKNGYLAQNAMMKTTGGQLVTQFNMKDSDYQGGLKLDFLTINALDRIRANMNLLLEKGLIEWQGSLRDTYDKYLHPDVLDFDSHEMYDLLYEGQILDAFQFDSAVGSQAVQKIKPQNFQELCAGNSLMRLSPESGESPLDKFVRHKQDIEKWYEEMRNAGLSDDEITLLESYLLPNYGLADTQEIMMLLSMDKNISSFGLTEANKLRKGVAKKSKEVIDECWEMFQEGCKKSGCSDNMRNYVWEVLFRPQFGYSFSLPHIASYTLILMQELNLAYRYGVVYWKTACLSVNSGLIGDIEGNPNYGAVAKAIGDMKGEVLTPDINESKLGFYPHGDKILFGLKPIAGLGKDAMHVVLDKRPFSSLKDFVERAVIGDPDIELENGDIIKDKTMSEKKGIILIKAGCFDSIEKKPRREIMMDYVKMVVPKKDKLTMTNLPHIIHKVPSRLEDEVECYEFRNKLFGRNKVSMSAQIEKYFLEHFRNTVKFSFENGELVVDQKSFDKEYKKIIEPLRQWVISSEAATEFNKVTMNKFWSENCLGTVEEWEMETISFYSDKHELDYLDLGKYFDISKFEDLPSSNIVEWKTWGKRKFPRYELGIISGTVVDKNKDKHIVYLSTQYGVVPLKYQKGAFLHYDKKVVNVQGKEKVVLDESWFKRGTKLVVVGYRRDDEFVPKVYKDTAYKHSTTKIIAKKGEVYLQQEKRFI
jgi:DNA polymerase-3 subunit alpha